MSDRCMLFALAREVRDMIYLELLKIPVAPPVCCKEAGCRYLENLHYKAHLHQHIFYPTVIALLGSAGPLSSFNGQIRTEIRELLDRQTFLKNATYELDVMLHGSSLWPTWTSSPSPIVTQIPHLKISYRLFDDMTEPYGHLQRRTLESLVNLLNRLLHHGPQFIHNGKRPYVWVDLLTLTVYDPTELGNFAVTWARSRFYDYLGTIMKSGFLLGKIGNLRVILNGETTDHDINAPVHGNLSHVGNVWGYPWGVDTNMRVEKVNSSVHSSPCEQCGIH